MKTKVNLLLIGIVGLVLLPDGYAVEPLRIQASVGDVTDTRSNGVAFFSGCKVELKFTGDAAAEAATIRNLEVIEAVDDTGRDLRVAKEEATFGGFDPENSGTVLKAEIKLKNPARRAAAIKVLRGSGQLFNPTEANGGIIVIPNALGQPTQRIAHPVLEKYGVELVYLTKEAYEARKQTLELNQHPASKLGDAFGELFQGMFAGMMTDAKESIQMFVHDPQKIVVELKFYDGEDNPLKTQGRMSNDEYQRINLEAPPPADARLRVQLAVPEATTSCTFELRDIPLP